MNTETAQNSLVTPEEPEKERRSPYSFKVFLGLHCAPEDLRKCEPYLASADILIPELAGNSEDYRNLLVLAAQRKTNPAKDINFSGLPENTIEWARLAYKYQKPTILIDIPRGELSRQIRRVLMLSDEERLKIEYDPRTADCFKSETQAVALLDHQFAQLMDERENYMISLLDERLEQAKNIYPELRGIAHPKVLLFLGAGHPGFIRKLRARGFGVEVQFDQRPMYYRPNERTIVSYSLTGGADEALVARKITYYVIARALTTEYTYLETNSNTFSAFVQVLLNQFGTEELEDIYLKTPSLRSDSYLRSTLELLSSALINKGLPPLPGNDENAINIFIKDLRRNSQQQRVS